MAVSKEACPMLQMGVGSLTYFLFCIELATKRGQNALCLPSVLVFLFYLCCKSTIIN